MLALDIDGHITVIGRFSVLERLREIYTLMGIRSTDS